MATIACRMEQTKGRGPNFDLIRLCAASLVLVSHAFPLTLGDERTEPLHAFSGGVATLGTFAVGIFFATSGFLVTASAERSRSLADFAWRRAIRILPALAVVTLVLAFVAGPLLTTSPDYWNRSETYRYLLNMVFLTQQSLPGVFETNPFRASVNGSLWTLFYEVACYGALAGCAAIGLLRRPAVLLVVLPMMLAFAASGQQASGKLEALRIFCQLGGFFLAGGLLQIYRERAPLSAAMAALAVLLTIISLRFGFYWIIGPIVVAYWAVWLGLQREVVRLPGDFSYGVYVWAFPTQQVFVQALPGQSWLENIACALPVTLLLGVLSWYAVERPALRFKRLPALLTRTTGRAVA